MLAADDTLATLIGCSPDLLPPLGTYYDLINRLWLRQNALDVADAKTSRPYPKNTKPKASPGKNKKLLNRHSGITGKIADFLASDHSFYFYYEKLLQEIFSLIAVVPSADLG
ncbi:hypothetical protein [Fusibacter sp. JL216-2]|uniref:hypothetical protein n=1 Tax=Fusibacter sp. JL216-2 TaxID=3071453 RepID=UPI003D349A7B